MSSVIMKLAEMKHDYKRDVTSLVFAMTGIPGFMVSREDMEELRDEVLRYYDANILEGEVTQVLGAPVMIHSEPTRMMNYREAAYVRNVLGWKPRTTIRSKEDER